MQDASKGHRCISSPELLILTVHPTKILTHLFKDAFSRVFITALVETVGIKATLMLMERGWGPFVLVDVNE